MLTITIQSLTAWALKHQGSRLLLRLVLRQLVLGEPEPNGEKFCFHGCGHDLISGMVSTMVWQLFVVHFLNYWARAVVVPSVEGARNVQASG